MQEASDFGEETEALRRLLAPLSEREFKTITQFKQWTINDVLQHIHIVNQVALLTLTDPAGFQEYARAMYADQRGLRRFENDWLKGISGRALLDVWVTTANSVATQFRSVDPKARLKWFGPDMSARSCITARQMETWAHGQEVFDILGADREETDRLKNIAHLGVATMGWTYSNRGAPVPQWSPSVRLIAPSGALWEWNAGIGDSVEGDAVDFCRVVTQVRNIADTKLRVSGETAEWWMRHAQCFAGRPQDPPAPGTRYKVVRA